jgi:hypothetical protein
MDLTKAPKVKLLSGATAMAFSKVMKDKEKMAEVQSMNDVSLFFGHGAKWTRDRRETIRAEFEFFVETTCEVTIVAEIWTIETILERTKSFLTVSLEVILEKLKGKKITNITLTNEAEL